MSATFFNLRRRQAAARRAAAEAEAESQVEQQTADRKSVV